MEHLGDKFISLIESDIPIESIVNHDLAHIIIRTGGIESLLVCFAEVVRSRHVESGRIHSRAFATLLRMAQTNQYHLTKFLDELNGLKLTEFILSHPLCRVSESMLKRYLDFCLLRNMNGQYDLIKSPKLIFHLLTSWRAWHKNISVARLLYKSLVQMIQLTRTEERNKVDHNYRMFSEAGGIGILMDILRECLIPVDEDVPNINHELIELIVNLITLLVRHPPSLEIMSDIMNFLIFLHPDQRAYIERYVDQFAYLNHSDTPKISLPRCSNRSYAISNIADMLASIVKLTSTDPLGILSEALQSSIIDPRKLIILAKNSSFLVREKVLRLFLYCIRACYSLDLKSVLGKYEQQDTKNPEFKLNIPIQLMAQQLLHYPTTIRMVQLCYGIIVGVDDFEAVDRVCLNFDIDRKNNHLQLNTLILLIQLTTQLQTDKEIVLTLQFIYAYINQLTELGEVDIVLDLIKRTLLDSVMKLYYICVDHKIQHFRLSEERLRRFGASSSEDSDEDDLSSELDSEVENISALHLNNNRRHMQDGCHDDDENDDDESIDDGFDEVLTELDRFLILITCSYLRNLPTNEAMDSISGLLLYFESLNNNIPPRFQGYLRDREVTLLATALHFCRHYEKFARQRYCGGKFDYLIKSIFKNNHLNSFSNTISDGEFVRIFLGNLYQEDTVEDCSSDDDCGDENTSSIYDGFLDNSSSISDDRDTRNNRRRNFSVSSDYGINGSSNKARGEAKEISEADVLCRFHTTFDFIVNFVTTREANVIPSSLERDLILSCIRTLYQNLMELCTKISPLYTYRGNVRDHNSASQRNTHWALLLPKLESLFRRLFSQLVLFVLSPCDAQNLCERRLLARKLFDELKIQVEVLPNLLEDDSSNRAQTLLLIFIRDLLDYTQNAQSASEDETVSEDLDDDVDCIEIRLRLLIVNLEYELRRSPYNMGELSSSTTQNGQISDSKKAKMKQEQQMTKSDTSAIDMKFKSIWLANLNQTREDTRDRARTFLEIKRNNCFELMNNSTTYQPIMTSHNGSLDRLIDEAESATQDVTTDKNVMRKIYLEEVEQKKVYNYHIRQQWLSLIIGHTHERAIWHLPGYYPESWELNPVEGPSRSRKRLRPCKLGLENRFLRDERVRVSAASPFKGKHSLMPTSNNNDGNNLNERHTMENLTTINNILRTDIRENSKDISKESKYASYNDGSNQSSDLFETENISSVESFADDWHNQYSPHPLCSLILNCHHTMDSNKLRIRMFTTDKIHFNCDCSIIRPNDVCEGEVSIASWCIHFIGERSDNYQRQLVNYAQNNQLESRPSGLEKLDCKHLDAMLDSTLTPPPLSTLKTLASSRRAYAATLVEDLWFDEIVEIWDRRYQLQDVGLELFLTNNMTYLLSFKTNRDREDFKHHLFREQHKMINLQRFNSTTCLNKLTRLWRDGRLSNFDYLTCLNKLAGRSFNDLMQYPIFPFILADYTSEVLDLANPSNFRKLDRPMAIQNKDRQVVFKKNYQFSQANLTTGPLGLTKPYHYGNHYSNSATVLHFLVRLPPFTQMLIQYQDNNFDQPDRTFHSIANTWQLITKDSNTDFKELIPEFFFLPEMFINIEQLELGKKQNGELVDDVCLPPWCPQSDARLFTLIHRQALESPYVSENLHHWIDLIFGHKQTGKPAIEAMNVFHPATYYGGIDLANHGSSGSSTVTDGTNGLSPNTYSSATSSSSLGVIGPIVSTISARSSKYDSDYISDADSAQTAASRINTSNGSSMMQHQDSNNQGPTLNSSDATANAAHKAHSSGESEQSSPRRVILKRHNNHHQADIERSALETMIKTYGQMPRQLFAQPVRQRFMNTYAGQPNQQSNNKTINMRDRDYPRFGQKRKIEPLRQVKGLKWGSYVGSPDEGEIIAISHRRLPDDDEIDADSARQTRVYRRRRRSPSNYQDRFHLCLLASGDVAILRKNSSLMLDYRADRKSNGHTYQLSLPSALTAKHEAQHRAGLSNIARMNLFSNMIISRQQFSFLEPIYSPTSQLDSLNTSASSSFASFTNSIRSRLTQESPTLVSWGFQDGYIHIKHPATSNNIGSLPLVQSDNLVDKMTTCCSIAELNLLLVGYQSGAICAHIVATTPELAKQLQANRSDQIPTIASEYAAPSAIHFLNHSNQQHQNQHPSVPSSSGLSGSGEVSTMTSRLDITNSNGLSNNNRYHENLHESSKLSGTPKNSSSIGLSAGGDSSLAGSLNTVQASCIKMQYSSSNPVNRTSRWLYCHNKKINCIKINVSFGIVVSGSDDGTSVIWDLNSLTYVRTIDYKIKSLVLKNRGSGVAAADTTLDERELDQKSATNHLVDDGTATSSRHHSYQRRISTLSDQDYLSWNYGRANTNRLFDYLCRCQSSLGSSAGPTPRQSVSSERDPDGKSTDPARARYSSASPYNTNSHRCCICCSGISLIAISDTLGDIVTVKNFSDRLAIATTTDTEDASSSRTTSKSGLSSSSSTSSSKSSSSSNASDLDVDNLTSVIYVHTINGSLIGYINCHTQVTAVCYSNAPEGVSVNVIVVGMSDGLVRLYSSWDLCRVKEFRISDMDSPVSSILYSRDCQLLYIAYDDDRMVVLRNKKRNPVTKPREVVICDCKKPV